MKAYRGFESHPVRHFTARHQKSPSSCATPTMAGCVLFCAPISCIDAGRVGIADRCQDIAIIWNGLEEFTGNRQRRFLALRRANP
ncbi:hypothetical protein FLX27_28555 [Agrobacterium tumefaciens]|nr:hypothetical protein FLX27_28555 [Agrobacterium tumefaciens]